MNMVSLRAKGVEPHSSRVATLRGWHLTFDVHHWFRHEGGVGNIHPSDDPSARVMGVVHECSAKDLARLDAVESRGVGYDRADVEVETDEGTVSAIAYVGLPSYLDPTCLPTRRYLNILVAGAVAVGLDATYIAELRSHPIHRPAEYPPFVHPEPDAPVFDRKSLAGHPLYTALAGAVFDMGACRPDLACVHDLFGGKDMTLFHLQRLDTSDGTETLADVAAGRISEQGRAYLNAYLNEYAVEFRYVGRYVYD